MNESYWLCKKTYICIQEKIPISFMKCHLGFLPARRPAPDVSIWSSGTASCENLVSTLRAHLRYFIAVMKSWLTGALDRILVLAFRTPYRSRVMLQSLLHSLQLAREAVVPDWQVWNKELTTLSQYPPPPPPSLWRDRNTRSWQVLQIIEHSFCCWLGKPI